MNLHSLLESVQGLLDDHGISASVSSFPELADNDKSLRMICITGDLGASRNLMKKQSRDHVVMVRVNDESIEGLDAWIQAGVASSRSEAAALFIREGLQLRNHELSELRAAIDKVERAKAELKERARGILGEESETSGQPR